MSINQVWPGIVAGEWHNNHHAYPNSARSGFKPWQVDSAWYYIKFMSMIGAVSSYRDSKEQFYSDHYGIQKAGKAAVVATPVEVFLVPEEALIVETV